MCAGARSLVHDGRGEGGAKRGGPRRREREGARGAMARRLAEQARELRRRGKRGAGGTTNADKLAPLGRERERGRARGRNRR
jgi:hypothetical protein